MNSLFLGKIHEALTAQTTGQLVPLMEERFWPTYKEKPSPSEIKSWEKSLPEFLAIERFITS